MDSIHRSLAVEEWHKIQMASADPGAHPSGFDLERVLGAFDLFVLHDQPGDIDDVCGCIFFLQASVLMICIRLAASLIPRLPNSATVGQISMS